MKNPMIQNFFFYFFYEINLMSYWRHEMILILRYGAIRLFINIHVAWNRFGINHTIKQGELLFCRYFCYEATILSSWEDIMRKSHVGNIGFLWTLIEIPHGYKTGYVDKKLLNVDQFKEKLVLRSTPLIFIAVKSQQIWHWLRSFAFS